MVSLPTPERILCFDPGETTGWAFFYKARLIHRGQIEGDHKALAELIKHYTPNVVVCEDYRIYGHKSDQHKWSRVHTLRLVGGIEAICATLGVRLIEQGAGQGKGFVTDDKLESWGYRSGKMRHANDAVRHGCHWLLFRRDVP